MEVVWAVPAHGRHRRCRSFFDLDALLALLAAAAASVASAGTVSRAAAADQRCDRTADGRYHYRQDNAGSIIHSMWPRMLKRALERCANVEVACHFLQERRLLRGKLLKAANEWKLLAKNDLIGSNDFSLKRWMVTFPEADEAIWRCRELTVNYKLLLTWLHLKWIGMYRLHRKIIGLL